MDSADVKAFFERVSTEWDEMRSSFYNAGVIDALAERGRVTSTSRVVDVGTGTGFVAAGLAGRAATVIGVDNSPAMLAVAADNLTAIGADNVMLAEGDVDDLRLPDASVDVAVATWCYITHRSRPRCWPRWRGLCARTGPSRSPTRSSIDRSGCAPNRPTSGSGSLPIRSVATSSKPGW